jgi:uncharacterized membrane protein YsdA (DUF1294 family)
MTVYLIAINLAGFLLALYDKRRAIKGRYRVPEKTLLLLACVGGSVGMFISMLIFRHKTRHMKFMLGIPAVILVQAAVVFLLLNNILGV